MESSQAVDICMMTMYNAGYKYALSEEGEYSTW